MQSEIKRWGNSAAVRLSSKVLAQSHLNISSPINIEVKEGKIIIESAQKPASRIRLPFSEKDLLRGLNAHTAHADELATPTDEELDQ